jgi:hypothetical protein
MNKGIGVASDPKELAKSANLAAEVPSDRPERSPRFPFEPYMTCQKRWRC